MLLYAAYTNNRKEDYSKEGEYIDLLTEYCTLLKWRETIVIIDQLL